jgi:hypothetical protein
MHSKKNYKWISELSNVRETKNSPTDGEEVRPQALDQSNKEVKNLSVTLAIGMWRALHILKSPIVSFPPNSPHETRKD